MKTKKLWTAYVLVTVISFAVLIIFGREIYREKPPVPEKVITESGVLLFSAQDIKDGQNIWQSIGGQQVGSIWGHGAYVAPDWSADWLHKEAVFLLDKWSRENFGILYDDLDPERKAMLEVRIQNALRLNTYDSKTGILTISDERADAVRSISRHYQGLFMDDPSLDEERAAYAIPVNTIRDPGRMDRMNAFFFWTAWACITNRPDSELTYTSNWPPDQVIGNTASAGLVLWTGFSVIKIGRASCRERV